MNNGEQTTARERQWLFDEKYGGVEMPEFLADCERLAAGEPLAYLIGHVPFLDTTIFLDSRPLIPRPETEYWVEKAIAEVAEVQEQNRNRQLSILDLCAGSGCIGVAVLKAVPVARVDFAEIDARYHPTIVNNIFQNGIAPSRVRMFGGDLFSEIADADTKYDFILANPPYIDPERIHHVEESVIQYEPVEALFGGTRGVEYVARIVRDTPQYLADSGVLYIEHEPEQRGLIHTLARSLPYASCITHPDQYRNDRYTRLAQAG